MLDPLTYNPLSHAGTAVITAFSTALREAYHAYAGTDGQPQNFHLTDAITKAEEHLNKWKDHLPVTQVNVVKNWIDDATPRLNEILKKHEKSAADLFKNNMKQTPRLLNLA